MRKDRQVDHDQTVNENLRFVQLTPPGSACSIAIGKGIIDKMPGSVGGLMMVVADIEAAHRQLSKNGVAVTDVHDEAWGRIVEFNDPDDNSLGLNPSERPRDPMRARGPGFPGARRMKGGDMWDVLDVTREMVPSSPGGTVAGVGT